MERQTARPPKREQFRVIERGASTTPEFQSQADHLRQVPEESEFRTQSNRPQIPNERNPISSGSQHFMSLIAARIAEEVVDRVVDKLQRPVPEKALFNVAEAAYYLGRTKSSIESMIHDRELPVVRNGRRVHLSRRDLDLWIEKRRA